MDVVQGKTNPQKVKPVHHRHTHLHGDILFAMNQALVHEHMRSEIRNTGCFDSAD